MSENTKHIKKTQETTNNEHKIIYTKNIYKFFVSAVLLVLKCIHEVGGNL